MNVVAVVNAICESVLCTKADWDEYRKNGGGEVACIGGMKLHSNDPSLLEIQFRTHQRGAAVTTGQYNKFNYMRRETELYVSGVAKGAGWSTTRRRKRSPRTKRHRRPGKRTDPRNPLGTSTRIFSAST